MVCQHNHFLATKIVLGGLTQQQKKKYIFYDTKTYLWDDPYLFKEGSDDVLRRCLLIRRLKVFYTITITQNMEATL